MTRAWRLSRQAEASLIDIATWTLETFGPAQAVAYEEDLIDRCRAIASGTGPWQSCRKAIDPRLAADLRFTRCGQHFIVFLDSPEAVYIVDIVPMRSNLRRRLARPANDLT